VTKITKHVKIEEELDRFVLNKGEEPQAMYNRLKTMVNQVRNLGSTEREIESNLFLNDFGG
jgi:Uri superfamily endonuclease